MNYDKNKYRKIDWRHVMMLHWAINPGLAFNELILGQRIPRVMLQERSREKPWIQRFHVPCPHCQAIHNGNTWNFNNKTGFRNWFGLYCPACGETIPCLWNIGSVLVLAVTSPLWYWFRNPLRKKWLKKQPARYANLDLATNDFDRYAWWERGLSWGFFMFVVISIFDAIDGEMKTIAMLGFNFLWWMMAGIVYGALTRFMQRKMSLRKKTD